MIMATSTYPIWDSLFDMGKNITDTFAFKHKKMKLYNVLFKLNLLKCKTNNVF